MNVAASSQLKNENVIPRSLAKLDVFLAELELLDRVRDAWSEELYGIDETIDICDVLRSKRTLNGCIKALLEWKGNLRDHWQPEAILSQFELVETPADAMRVALAFKKRLGLVAICRVFTGSSRKPTTLFDELFKDIKFWSDGWNVDNLYLLREAFGLVGFKHSSECSAKTLIDDFYSKSADYAYIDDSSFLFHIIKWRAMVASLPHDLGILLRARRLRYKTTQHFVNLDKVEYDYEEMKQSRAKFHTEFETVFRFFRRLVKLRYATPIAVAVPVEEPSGWVKTHRQ